MVLLSCLVQLLSSVIVSCFAMFGYCLLEACSFLKGKGDEMDLEEGAAGRSGRKGNCLDVLYEKEEFVFNKKWV